MKMRDQRNTWALMRSMGMAACLLFPFAGRAEINSAFTAPPYKLNETAVGIEGWELLSQESNPIYGDPLRATVVDSPIISPTQPSTLELKTWLTNRWAEDLGDRIVVETQFALNSKSNASYNGGLSVRLGRTAAATPFEFGFHYGEDGGLYYQGSGDRVILLPTADVQQRIAYKFTVYVDLFAGTFRVLVTSPGDTAFRYESKDVAFREEFSAGGKIREFVMGNSKPSMLEAYVDYVKVIPE